MNNTYSDMFYTLFLQYHTKQINTYHFTQCYAYIYNLIKISYVISCFSNLEVSITVFIEIWYFWIGYPESFSHKQRSKNKYIFSAVIFKGIFSLVWMLKFKIQSHMYIRYTASKLKFSCIIVYYADEIFCSN